MKTKQKLKSLPIFKTDKEAEDFVHESDLTEYDLSGFKPMKFEFANKTARINMRLPEVLLERIKKIADQRDIPYTRFIRQILEAVVEQELRSRAKKA